MPQPTHDPGDLRDGLEVSFDRKPRVPLFIVLLAVVLGVSLSPLFFFSLYTVNQMRVSLVASQQERQLQQASSATERLDAFLEQSGREALKLAHVLGARLTNDGSSEAAVLTGILDESAVLARFRPAGSGPTQTSIRGLVLPAEIEQALEREAEMLLRNASAGTEVLLGGPFAIGPEGMLAVTISAPVTRGWERVGVLQEVVSFQPVWDQIEAAILPPTRVYLLGPQGSVVARIGRAAGDGVGAPGRREAIQQFLGVGNRSRGSRAYDVLAENGEMRRCLGSFASTERGWGVFLEVDESLALAPARRMTQGLLMGGAIAAALAIGAALLLGSMISRPMARLAAISKRLASGDFSVSAPGSRVKELDELAEVYTRMSRRLGDLVEKFRTAARDANDLFLGTIRALAEAIDEKDPYTKGHSIRVNRYAVIIGRYLGLSREDLRALHVSSLLHDVGKIGIDDAILKKPAALTADEFDIMKTHPERGAKIMGRIPQMKNTVPGMRFHHERWSGGGYPLGLKGEEIPLQARIVAVADTFDAMTTDRPYQRALPIADAVARINDMKSVHLDPQVVEAFNRAYEAGEFDSAIAALSGPVLEEEGIESGAVSTAR